jgi:hypothetical protein
VLGLQIQRDLGGNKFRHVFSSGWLFSVLGFFQVRARSSQSLLQLSLTRVHVNRSQNCAK